MKTTIVTSTNVIADSISRGMRYRLMTLLVRWRTRWWARAEPTNSIRRLRSGGESSVDESHQAVAVHLHAHDGARRRR